MDEIYVEYSYPYSNRSYHIIRMLVLEGETPTQVAKNTRKRLLNNFLYHNAHLRGKFSSIQWRILTKEEVDNIKPEEQYLRTFPAKFNFDKEKGVYLKVGQ